MNAKASFAPTVAFLGRILLWIGVDGDGQDKEDKD